MERDCGGISAPACVWRQGPQCRPPSLQPPSGAGDYVLTREVETEVVRVRSSVEREEILEVLWSCCGLYGFGEVVWLIGYGGLGLELLAMFNFLV
jgi:hypothetical protein